MSRTVYDLSDLSQFFGSTFNGANIDESNATEMVRMLLVDALHDNVCEVKFTKADGTERVMECTLQGDHIPEDKVPKGKIKAENLETIRAYDVVTKDWRSFRIDSVHSFSF